jgi:hypothetical protein
MKKILLLLMISGIWLSSCDDKEDDDKEKKASTESAGTRFNQVNFGKARILDKEVDSVNARKCIDSMQALFEGTDYDAIKASYTNSVAFGSANLRQWLTDKNIFENSDSIVLCLGIYTKDAIRDWNIPEEHYGRITVFIWPYKNGYTASPVSIANPFNVGSLHP